MPRQPWWILLGLLVIVIAAASYLAVEAADWAGDMVPASFVAAAGSGCLVLGVAMYARSRRSQSTGGIELRLDRIASPTTPPESRDLRRKIEHGDMTGEPDVTSGPDGDVQPTPTDPPRDIGESQDGADPSANAPTRDEPSGQPVVSPPMTSAILRNPREHPPPAIGDETDGVVVEDAEIEAIRLAAALNQYEQIGFHSDGYAASDSHDLHGEDRTPKEQMLWSELVEVYGAESIDLRDVGDGRCRITLRSGNMVFYVPEYRQWVWLAFEQSRVAVSNVTILHPVDRDVNNADRTNWTSPRPSATPDPVEARTGNATHKGTPTGLMRLARSSLGRRNPNPQAESRSIRVVGMTQVLSSQNTPAAYEEALFVTEGLLLGAAYGSRVVPYEELVWVVEAATGHSLHLQSMGRFLGDLVERSYPRHMSILSALAVPASASNESAVGNQRMTEADPAPPQNDDGSTADGTVVDLTDSGIHSQQRTAASQPS